MNFQEINLSQTRKNAKNVLKNYRCLERIAGSNHPVLVTKIPQEGLNENVSAELTFALTAEAQKDAILAALMAVPPLNRQILHYSFCVRDQYTNLKIADELGYSLRQIERLKAEALIAFAESYCGGQLIDYR